MTTKQIRLTNYFKKWMETFKRPVVSPVTYIKYQNTYRQIEEYFGDTRLKDLTRTSYQMVINTYAESHSKLTTACFHKQIRAALLDAVDERIISIDPTRKVIVTGRPKSNKKSKYLNLSDWQKLTNYTSAHLQENSFNLIIYLSAVTGMRFAEVLGLTWNDIDFKRKQLIINKTWDYKYHTGFIPTKNVSSNRKIEIDIHTKMHLKELKKKRSKTGVNLICTDSEGNVPVSMTINRYLLKLCNILEIEEISFHGLRHTHASILLFKGVNVMTVSRRLGHSNTTTTQSVYLHIIREMENKESKLIIGFLNKALE